MFSAVLLALTWQPAVGAAAQKIIASSGPLSSIYIDEDFGCQVQVSGDTSPSFFGGTEPGACGTFLALTAGEDVGPPEEGVHLFGPNPPAGVSPQADFTPVAQTLTGQGTANEPYLVTTRVSVEESAVTGAKVEVAEVIEEDSYITGEDNYETTVTVKNLGNARLEGTVYHAGDCYLANLDVGYGAENVPSAGSVDCTITPNDTPSGRFMAFTPISTGGLHNGYGFSSPSHLESLFATVWEHVKPSGEAFPNTIEATTEQDNAMGLSWPIHLNNPDSSTEEHTATLKFTTTISPTVGTIQETEGAPFTAQVATKPTCGIESTPVPSIDWGDGQTSEGTLDETGGVSGTHTYAEAGIYKGKVTYHNECGTQTVGFEVQVADAALSATGAAFSAMAGTPVTATVATFDDANPDGTASDYSATIDWGDGTATAGTVTPSAGGGFAVSGSHTYADAGAYTTSITIDDIGGATATATGSANVANPPPGAPTVLTTAPPTVTTTTSANFTMTVNPHGLATLVHFEYGPELPDAKAAAVTYESDTPNQSVNPDYANHTITATVTGLLPNVTYHMRGVATNSAGSTTGADQTLTTPADPPPPPPVLGKSANVIPVSGIVYIELPPGATLASLSPLSPFSPFSLAASASAPAPLTKGLEFVPLTEARQIPVGSTLDTTAGVAQITTATTSSKKAKLQTGDFGAGLFKLLQSRKQRGLTELNIIDSHSPHQVCASIGKAHTAAKSKHLSSTVLGRLNSNDHGNFTTRGQYSASTVRGTVYSVINECRGTLTEVSRGLVSVRDFARRKTITLHTGQHYLAKAPR
jgi:hypothetical protein